MFPSRRITTMGGGKFKNEYVLSFDGGNDYINVDGLASVFSTDNAYSMTCWFMNTESGGAGGDDEHKSIIFSANDVSDSYANIFRIGVNVNNDASPVGGIYVADNQGNTTIHTDSSDKDTGTKYHRSTDAGDKWYHLAVTIAGGAGDTTIKVFINGSELTNHYGTAGGADSNVIDPQWDNADKFRIGQEADDEDPISANLQAWYRMGDGLENHSGSTIYDMSNNSNNGTMVNMDDTDYKGDLR